MALPIFIDNHNVINPTINATRWLKYTFLSFTQALFNQYDEFKWNPNRSQTKIIIQDKYTSNNTNPEKVPQIILTVGGYRWVRTSMDSITKLEEGYDTSQKHKKMDLMRSSASLSCIANDATTSSHIADILWLALFSYKVMLRQHGIHFIQSIDVGECVPMKTEVGNSKIELFNTPVILVFDYVINFEKNVDYGGYVYSLLPPTCYDDYFFVPEASYIEKLDITTTQKGIYNSLTNDYIEFGEIITDCFDGTEYILGSGIWHPRSREYFSIGSGSEYSDILVSGIIAQWNLGNPGLIDTFAVVVSGFPGTEYISDSSIIYEFNIGIS